MIIQRLTTIADVIISEEQTGFRKGRSYTDNAFVLKQLIEKRREFNLETHIVFIGNFNWIVLCTESNV